MSAASSSPSWTGPPPWHTLFLPMLIFLLGSGALALYQVMSMEDRLDKVTQAVDKMDGKVKRAEDEKAKFYNLVRGVLRLAPTDPNAEQIANYFKLRELQAAQPALMNLNTPNPEPESNLIPESATVATNLAPIQPMEITNAASFLSPSSPTK